MIKLTLRVGETHVKMLVDFNPEQQPTVISFLKRVVEIN